MNHPRRVIVQVRRKAGELIPDYLFLVTNMETRPEMVVSLYAKRGTMENYIKECKNGFRMDKVSHKYWMTNVQPNSTRGVSLQSHQRIQTINVTS